MCYPWPFNVPCATQLTPDTEEGEAGGTGFGFPYHLSSVYPTNVIH